MSDHTSLAFLRSGAPWPPSEDQERMQLYQENEWLYDGKGRRVFQDLVRYLQEDNQTTMVLLLNWFRRLSKLWADLAVGAPPEFKPGDGQDEVAGALKDIVKLNRLPGMSWKSVVDVSRFGVSPLKVRYDGRQKRGVIETVHPKLWYPVVAADNAEAYEAHVIAYTFQDVYTGDPYTGRKREWLRAEIHEPGLITNRLFEVSGGRIGKEYDLAFLDRFKDVAETYETGLDGMLVFPVFNSATTSRREYDDYTDLVSILREINSRINQISRVLDKHTDPAIAGPKDLDELDEVTGQTMMRMGGKYFGLEPDTTSEKQKDLRYIEFNSALEGQYRELDVLLSYLYNLSETSPTLFGDMKAGLAESGSALRRLLMAPLIKTTRLRTALGAELEAAIIAASQLEVNAGKAGAKLIEDVTINWRDILPEDSKERAEIAATRVRSGTQSRKSAVMVLDHCSDEAADEEVGRILGDRAEDAKTLL